MLFLNLLRRKRGMHDACSPTSELRDADEIIFLKKPKRHKEKTLQSSVDNSHVRRVSVNDTGGAFVAANTCGLSAASLPERWTSLEALACCQLVRIRSRINSFFLNCFMPGYLSQTQNEIKYNKCVEIELEKMTQGHVRKCSKQNYCQETKDGNSLDIHQLMNGQTKWEVDIDQGCHSDVQEWNIGASTTLVNFKACSVCWRDVG